jgi:hypothetical protein
LFYERESSGGSKTLGDGYHKTRCFVTDMATTVKGKEKFSQALKKYLLGVVMLMELTAVTIEKMG